MMPCLRNCVAIVTKMMMNAMAKVLPAAVQGCLRQLGSPKKPAAIDAGQIPNNSEDGDNFKGSTMYQCHRPSNQRSNGPNPLNLQTVCHAAKA